MPDHGEVASAWTGIPVGKMLKNRDFHDASTAFFNCFLELLKGIFHTLAQFAICHSSSQVMNWLNSQKRAFNVSRAFCISSSERLTSFSAGRALPIESFNQAGQITLIFSEFISVEVGRF